MLPIMKVTLTSADSTGNVCEHLPADAPAKLPLSIILLLTERQKDAYWHLKIAGENPYAALKC